MKVVPMHKFNEKTAEYLAKLPLVITRYNRPIAIIVAPKRTKVYVEQDMSVEDSIAEVQRMVEKHFN